MKTKIQQTITVLNKKIDQINQEIDELILQNMLNAQAYEAKIWIRKHLIADLKQAEIDARGGFSLTQIQSR